VSVGAVHMVAIADFLRYRAILLSCRSHMAYAPREQNRIGWRQLIIGEAIKEPGHGDVYLGTRHQRRLEWDGKLVR
jgi:hypothetical protein